MKSDKSFSANFTFKKVKLSLNYTKMDHGSTDEMRSAIQIPQARINKPSFIDHFTVYYRAEAKLTKHIHSHRLTGEFHFSYAYKHIHKIVVVFKKRMMDV